MPTTVSLEEQPYSVSWPDSPGFIAKLKVESGPEGADFRFEIEPSSWNNSVYGIVFRDGQPELEGPGVLTSSRNGPGGPWGQPGSCLRGAGPIPVYANQLTLPPDSSTLVEIPVSLNASPLTGMDSTLRIKYFVNSPERAPTVTAPVETGGTQGVDVDFGIGDPATKSAEVWNGKAIRLAGVTTPALAKTEIRIKAEPFAGPANAFPPIRWIKVTTDASGEFLSKELRFRRSAFWRLRAYPQVGPQLDGEPSCGPVLLTRQDSWRAEPADLTDRTFRSVSVKGNKLVGQTKITLSFASSLIDHDDDPFTPSRWRYWMTGNAGCNTFSGRYWLKEGRLTWSRGLRSTKMACAGPADRWLKRTLRRGVRARIEKGQLILRGTRGTRIVLAPAEG